MLRRIPRESNFESRVSKKYLEDFNVNSYDNFEKSKDNYEQHFKTYLKILRRIQDICTNNYESMLSEFLTESFINNR